MPEASFVAGAMSRAAALHRLVVVLVLGFASGLPLALTGQAMQAWLSMEGLDVATIGFLSLVGLPYPFKFLWAPLLDRFDLPWLGRRRGWLVLTQLALAGMLLLAGTSPVSATRAFALLAVAVAFMSASQDVVIDAYRTDLLPARERGLGSSLNVMGYRLAMILSGGIALIWTDPAQGGGWRWPQVYHKVIGLWLTIGGALLGGLLMLKLGQWRSLLLFGILQAASNLGFWWLAVSGKGSTPGLVLPAFDWSFVQLAQPTPVDGVQHPVRADEGRPADRAADRRPDVRRRAGASRGAGLRDGPAERAASGGGLRSRLEAQTCLRLAEVHRDPVGPPARATMPYM
jgi:MFS family permease